MLQAAKGSFLGTDGDLDIVTGRRVPKSTMLQERRAEQEGREEMAHLRSLQVGFAETVKWAARKHAHRERRCAQSTSHLLCTTQVGLEKQLAVPYMDAEERNFQTDARSLQQRLVRGVMAEMEQEQTSLGDRYSE